MTIRAAAIAILLAALAGLCAAENAAQAPQAPLRPARFSEQGENQPAPKGARSGQVDNQPAPRGANQTASNEAASKPEKPAKPAKVAACVFDFNCPADAEYGKKLADAIRMRLARHEEFDVMDRLTTAEFVPALPAGADSNKVVAMMTKRLAVEVAVYGTVVKDGDRVRLELACVDLRPGAKRKTWRKDLSDNTQRPEAVISKDAVEAVTAEAEWVPPQYGDEPEPSAAELGEPVNVNGAFDQPGHAGWQAPDNAASFLEPGPAGRGTILRTRTDLARAPYIDYIRAIRMGRASPANPPTIATETGYGCLGGFEGVHFKSDWIKATPGQRYWLLADFDRPDGKVFVKGFKATDFALDGLPESVLAAMNMTAEQFAALSEAEQKKRIAEAAKKDPKAFLRECYRWYLNCRGQDGKWNHLAAPFPPRGGLPADVQWLQIQVYTYWPAGTYRWDNVLLYKDPRQKAPLPEEKPRTPKGPDK
jgi:TolB-like protein